jgi:hypothetical protein
LRQSWQHPEEPKQVSVANYYWEVYKHRLKYPNAPALDVGRKEKPIYIPLEVWFFLYCFSASHIKCAVAGPLPQDKRKKGCAVSFLLRKLSFCIVVARWYSCAKL